MGAYDKYINPTLNLIITSLGRGLRLYLFFWLLLALFRVAFVFIMRDYMSDSWGFDDIIACIWRGMMLSMKTVGLVMLMSWLPSAIVSAILPRGGLFIGKLMSCLFILFFTVLFIARFPFYKVFHSTFNQIVFNTTNDDIGAIIVTMQSGHNLTTRLIVALVMALIICVLLHFWMNMTEMRIHLSSHTRLKKSLTAVALIAMALVVTRLSQFGGSISWQNELTWENVGTARDHLLNEAMLDDLMALYRGYELQSRLLSSSGLAYTEEDVRRLAAWLTGREESDDITAMLTREARGAMIKKPRHIFLIIGESYANWPLLEKYKNIHIADGMRSIIAQNDTAYCGKILPNGSATVSAVTGIVTGLADANLYLTTMPEALSSPYVTAAAPAMESLGYGTHFWYAGPSTWERIGTFVTAQGFDRFTGRGDIRGDGNVWGADDEFLYAKILSSIPEDAPPSFNVILNTSNHSPFTVDVVKKGFDAENVRMMLPKDAQKDDELIRMLGHFWYEDKEMTKFIHSAEIKYPGSLFIIVGDHADRVNIEKTPGTYERFVVPLIIHGEGVSQNLFIGGAAGSQIDIIPTLIEMIAPAGHRYASLGESLTRTARRGANYMLWITGDAIGKTDETPLTPESIDGNTPPAINHFEMQSYIDAIRSISMWIGKGGKTE